MASIIVNDMLPILESEDDVTDLEVDEKAQFLLDTPKSDISESLWNLFKDVWRFLSYEELPSVRADKEGLQIGDFLLKHADIAGEMEEVRSDLEKSINIPEIKIEVTYFKNWAGTQTRGLLLYAKPETVHHVIAIVKAAKDKSLKVGCGGAYHSWSPIFPDICTSKQKSLLLNMTKLKLQDIPWPWRRIKHNKTEKTITIVPGVSIGELSAYFMCHDICFYSDVVLQTVTYGGILATGSHGVGKDQESMSDLITSIKIVDYNGELKTYDKPTSDATGITKEGMVSSPTPQDIFNAVRVSLGLFGVMVEMTLKVEDLQYADVHTSYPKVGEFFFGEKPAIVDMLRRYWSVETFWFPFNSIKLEDFFNYLQQVKDWDPKKDEVWVRAINHCNVPSDSIPNIVARMEKKLNETLQESAFGGVVNPILSRYPALTPAILSFGFKMTQDANPALPEKIPLPYAIHFRFGVSLATVYDMEFAFPFSIHNTDDHYFDNVLKAIDCVVTHSETSAHDGSFPLSTVMELRIIAKSDCLLCPATKNALEMSSTHTAYLEIVSFGGTKNYEKFFETIGKAWLGLGGIPHWGKQWSFLDDVQNTEEGDDVQEDDDSNSLVQCIEKYYGKNLETFRAVFRSINAGDNNKMFLNSTMKRILRLE